ncbi:efflux transporter outer membrane subunit [Xylophilus sp. GOD-11R]|uniref:efflux transporter outer membrane subunit n=1 Tax=Xylophilus sp. GOD-11R TaxID=3089814 RepID=UPI00298C3212|nr:efflux transporter outer membrane subunit [Xylophilus sp. GOD-11R]WPB55075.1 efflux transporter outer membrane subunit [Xylophilus sp. GOD-11R]
MNDNNTSSNRTGGGRGAALYLGTLVLALGLTACANMAGIAPQAQLRDGASLGLPSAATGTPDLFADAAMASDWWRGFGDERLDDLVSQAIADSPSLKSAEARLQRAQAAADTTRAADGPQLNGSLDATRQHFSSNGIYPAPLGGGTFNIGTARLAGSYEFDFFGKNRAALESALGTANAAKADAQAARLLLACNVARNYFQLARLQAQLEVAERTLAQRQETLGLVRDRVTAGLDTRLEERQSQAGIPEARQQIEALHEQIAIARNAIGALVGQPRGMQDLEATPLASYRDIDLPSTLPADLLGRRADVAAARWRVEAAAKTIDVAKTEFYPNVNLTAFVGLNSLGFDNLVQGSSREWGVGPAIRLPIFDSGRLRANLRGRTADYDAAVESYNGAVIDAVHEAADQAASARSIELQQTQQKDAQAAAEAAYDIARQRYRAGLGTYLNVLTSENAVLSQRRLAVDLAARRLDTQVSLIRALGGGYTPETTVASVATAVQR